MNRKLFALALGLLTCLGVMAQGTTAMLQSGEKFSVYYGPDALQQAYKQQQMEMPLRCQ